MPKKNLIPSIEGKRLNGYVLHVNNISRGRFVEETNFEFYKPWLEIYYDNRVKFKSSKIVDLSERELDEKLFKHLSDFLPLGAHVMVVYLNHEETRKGLEQGVPAPATPIGYLLWKSGCTWFKDWYFAEGFWEGDIKLQGNKPLNEENRRKDLLETRKELTEFLKKEKGKEKLFLDARKRAEDVLKDMARRIRIK